MSLKTFHLFFIAVSILFLVGFGLWFFVAQPSGVYTLNIFGGLLSISLAGGMVVYAIRVRRKLKSIPTW